MPLTTAEPAGRVDWFATVFADPSKPQFALVFRNAGPPRETWEADTKNPIAIIADGRRHEMKPFQAVVSEGGKSLSIVSVGGPRSILAAIVAATQAEIEFGGRRFTLSQKALTNCRELLKWSSTEARKQN